MRRRRAARTKQVRCAGAAKVRRFHQCVRNTHIGSWRTANRLQVSHAGAPSTTWRAGTARRVPRREANGRALATRAKVCILQSAVAGFLKMHTARNDPIRMNAEPNARAIAGTTFAITGFIRGRELHEHHVCTASGCRQTQGGGNRSMVVVDQLRDGCAARLSASGFSIPLSTLRAARPFRRDATASLAAARTNPCGCDDRQSLSADSLKHWKSPREHSPSPTAAARERRHFGT